MTPDSRPRLEALCLEALSKDAADRAAFLDEACGADAGLRREIESLLAGRSEAAAFLESPAFAAPAPPLLPGTRLGPYEILARLGAGGMGEVYKARDTRLDRVVALKVLSPAFAEDPDRRARFEREAKTVAGLSHPNICPLHDVGREVPRNGGGREVLRLGSDGPRSEQADTQCAPLDFLVMDCLEGQTLAARLEKGKLRLDEALALGAQIADALAAAHRQGVIHRDLKPANVMLTRSGGGSTSSPHAKLLDFGLARLTGHGEQAVTSRLSSAVKSSLTAEGTIVGTLHYMAPEQLEGKPVDARTDIWALGTILYEMVTGQRAFEGASAPSLMAAILEHEAPPLTSLQPLAPASLNHVVSTCLEKDPEARWQAAGDVARELRWVAAESRPARDAASGARGTAGFRKRRLTRRAAILATAAVALALGGIAFWLSAGPSSAPPHLVHLTTSPGDKDYPALSPDGKQIAFMWAGEDGSPTINVKYIGDSDARRVMTRGNFPCWSPDGRRIAFRRPIGAGKWAILTMSALGGDERKIGEVTLPLGPMSWSPDGRWLAVDNAGGIYLQPTAGGEPVRVTYPPGASFDMDPAFSWDGRHLAFARSIPSPASTLLVQPLTPGGLPRGAPRQVSGDRMMIAHLAWHPDGKSIVFVGQSALMLSYLYRVSIDGGGSPERIDLAGPRVLRLSTAAGRNQLVFYDSGIDWDIWRVAPNARLEPLVRSSLFEWSPDFSPDGQRLAFSTNRNGETVEVWTANADGSNPAQLTHGPGRNQGSADWSPDGRSIAFDSQGADGTFDIYVIDSGGGQPRRVTSERSNEQVPRWSRDGKWIYFRSDRTGSFEGWRVPVAGEDWQRVTGKLRSSPVESADGKTLIFVGDAGEVVAKPLDGGAGRKIVDFASNVAVSRDGIYYWGRASADRTLPLMFHRFSTKASTELARVAASASGPGLAVSPDGKTLLCVSSIGSGGQIMMIDNFR